MSTPILDLTRDARVIVLTGPRKGQVGVIDEIDLDDPVDTYRVRFGNDVRWSSANNLMIEDGAR